MTRRDPEDPGKSDAIGELYLLRCLSSNIVTAEWEWVRLSPSPATEANLPIRTWLFKYNLNVVETNRGTDCDWLLSAGLDTMLPESMHDHRPLATYGTLGTDARRDLFRSDCMLGSCKAKSGAEQVCRLRIYPAILQYRLDPIEVSGLNPGSSPAFGDMVTGVEHKRTGAIQVAPAPLDNHPDQDFVTDVDAISGYGRLCIVPGERDSMYLLSGSRCVRAYL